MILDFILTNPDTLRNDIIKSTEDEKLKTWKIHSNAKKNI